VLLGLGVDALLVVDERNGNEGGVVQNDLGYGISGVVEK
jgi:hypothetical protein